MAERQYIKISVDDRVALLTIDYPPMNLLNSTTIGELNNALDEILADPMVKAVVLTGGGEFVFIAGADINEVLKMETPQQAREMLMTSHQVFNKIEKAAKPFIAAINGPCLGGGLELALACHIRIANNRAQLGNPEITLGIIPGFGATQRLPRLVGKGKALELLLTGDRVSGAEAQAIGLVNKAVPAGEVLKTAMGMAKKIANHGRLAITAAMEAVREGSETSLEKGLEIEAEEFSTLIGSEDMKEGLSAFLQKRQPQFVDR